MMRAAALLAVLAAAFAVLTPRTLMEPEVSSFSHVDWIKKSRAPADEAMEVIFVLQSSPTKQAALEAVLLDRADPASPRFRQWLSHEQLAEITAADASHVAAVSAFLHSLGVYDFKLNRLGDRIRARMSVAEAEEAFGARLYAYEHAHKHGIRIVRADGPYSLPAHVAEAVAMVSELLRFPNVPVPLEAPGADTADDASSSAWSSCGAKCNNLVTPAVLQERYGFAPVSRAQSGNSMGVAEFQGQYYDNTDISAFNDACGVSASVDAYTGSANNPVLCTTFGQCVEALLDVETIGGVAGPTPLTFMYSSSYSIIDYADQLTEMDNAPLTNSVSYGNDEQQQTSSAYMQSCSTAFLQAGVLGLTVFISSGDQGAWGREGKSGNIFHPSFPASIPYITAVGGTNFAAKSTIGEETSWDCSGGGFSDTFTMPSYQSSFVAKYKSTATLPSSSLYNTGNARGLPDLSALGGGTNPYCVAYDGGSFTGVYGTSASSPTVAGIFALINGQLLSKGLSPLGFVNSFIYANSNCFNDVTTGDNSCSYSAGFEAAAGWDPVTGLGTPQYECLLSAAISAGLRTA